MMVMVRGMPIHMPVITILFMGLSWLTSPAKAGGLVIWLGRVIGVMVVVKVAMVVISVTGALKVVAVVMAEMVTVSRLWSSLGRMEPFRGKFEVRQVEGSQDHLSGWQKAICTPPPGFSIDPGDDSVSDTPGGVCFWRFTYEVSLTLLALLRTLR